MGRPTKSEKRDQQLNLKLTLREIAWLRSRAAQTGMRLVDFGRGQLLAERALRPSTKGPSHGPDPLHIAQIARLGNNLNQIARRMNTLDVPPPPALGPLLEAIRDIIRKGTGCGS